MYQANDLHANVFQPLGMTSAGFGAPGTPTVVDQPYGHARLRGRLDPVDPGPLADNPPAIGPAGTVHCSVEDLLKFAASHAGTGSLVSENILQRLHRRYGASEYSPGWYVVQRDWGRGYVLNHDGSNTYWLASMWIAPLRKTAFVATSNAPGPSGQQACWQAINHMIGRLVD
jgi:CubicO group peptidase (beta-lactamase class C family)